MNHRIYIKDWTTLPGARFRKEGPGSAEEFRDEHLLPLLDDGAYGPSGLR